jgi:hypothetical protein
MLLGGIALDVPMRMLIAPAAALVITSVWSVLAPQPGPAG